MSTERRLLRKWLEPHGDADSYVRLDMDAWGSTDEDKYRYVNYDLKIADCQRSIRLSFTTDRTNPKEKRKALRKLAILQGALDTLKVLLEED